MTPPRKASARTAAADIVVVDESELSLPDRSGSEDRQRTPPVDPGLSTGPGRDPLSWWVEADLRRRAVVLAAVVGVGSGAAGVTAAVRARHRDVTLTRTVPAPAPIPVDALGCPVTRTCRIVGAPNAAAAVQDAVVASTMSAQTVLDAQVPATVYARRVHATGTFNHAPAALWVVASCGTQRRRNAAAALPTVRMIVAGTILTQSYTQRYDGDCSITVWSRYTVEFTTGGYPEPSQDVSRLVEVLATDPRIKL